MLCATPRPSACSLQPAASSLHIIPHPHTAHLLQFNTAPPTVAPGGPLEDRDYLRMGWLLWHNNQTWEQVAKAAGFDP